MRLLNYSMYGTRRAAHNWQVHFNGIMIRAGFIQGLGSPCAYYHPGYKVYTIVHGDDFVSTGSVNGLAFLQRTLEK